MLDIVGYCESEQGLGKKENQDSCFYHIAKLRGKPICIGAVADGVTNTKSGGYASGDMIRKLARWFNEELKKLDENTKIEEELKKTIHNINMQIKIKNDKEREKLNGETYTASTLVCVLIQDGNLHAFSAGDSRTYLLPEDIAKDIEVLSGDDSNSDGKITNYLGAQNLKLKEKICTLSKRDIIILASDGAYKHSQWLLEKGRETLKSESPIKIVKGILKKAEDKKEKDDKSVVCIKVV